MSKKFQTKPTNQQRIQKKTKSSQNTEKTKKQQKIHTQQNHKSFQQS